MTQGSAALSVRELDVRLPADPTAAGAAREFVRTAARRWRLPPRVREVALLVASELVTNAVQHTGAASHLVLRREHSWLVVAVHDPDPRPPRRAAAPEGSLSGLDVVAALAVDWGVDQAVGLGDAPGKTVWARLAVTRYR